MDQPLLARQIKMSTSKPCDFEHPDNPFTRVIKKGKVGYQVVGDETIKAQGLYHSRFCYEAALKKYDEELEKMEESNE